MVIDEITQINDKLELCCVFSKTVCKSPAAGGRESAELRAETAGREARCGMMGAGVALGSFCEARQSFP